MVGLGGFHLFDSMAVDRDGNLCVATAGDRCGITVITPDARSHGHIELPGPMPTNLCFDADMKMAYATLSPQGELVAWEWSSTASPEF
jgi:gluconolactonase